MSLLFVVFVNEQDHLVAEKAVDVAMNYVSRNTKLGVKIDMKKVFGNRTDAKGLLDSRKLTITQNLCMLLNLSYLFQCVKHMMVC